MLKAIAGGGGRGMRVVHDAAALDEAYARCRSEAEAAFGRGDLYVERLSPARAPRRGADRRRRHRARSRRLGERECTLQRRHQKLVEIAPSPSLGPALRERLDRRRAAAWPTAVRYESLGTFEFLVDADAGADGAFYFLEANPRLQVEHTVTEAVTGIDLVVTQLRLAGGARARRARARARAASSPRAATRSRRASTWRRCAPTATSSRPAARSRSSSRRRGPGVRVDTLRVRRLHDEPALRLVAREDRRARAARAFAAAVARADRALAECRIEGVPTNLGFLQALLPPSRRRRQRGRHGLRRAPRGRADGGRGRATPRLYFASVAADPGARAPRGRARRPRRSARGARPRQVGRRARRRRRRRRRTTRPTATRSPCAPQMQGTIVASRSRSAQMRARRGRRCS